MSSAGGSRLGRTASGGHAEEEFEINIAPIIDCFTVLITYLLVSASFISLGAFDVSVSTPSLTAPSKAKPNETPGAEITVELRADHEVRVRVTGPENVTLSVPAADGGWDQAGIVTLLGSLKEKWPAAETVTVSANDQLEYRELVRAVETVRNVFPAVSLGDPDVSNKGGS